MQTQGIYYSAATPISPPSSIDGSVPSTYFYYSDAPQEGFQGMAATTDTSAMTYADYYGKNPSHYWYDEHQMMNMYYPKSKRVSVYRIVDASKNQFQYIYCYYMTEKDLPRYAIPIPLGTSTQDQLYSQSIAQTLGLGDLTEDQLVLYSRVIQQQKELDQLQQEVLQRRQLEEEMKKQLLFYQKFSTDIAAINQNICTEYYKKQQRFNQAKRSESPPYPQAQAQSQSQSPPSSFRRVKGQPSPPGMGRDFRRKQRKREAQAQTQAQSISPAPDAPSS